MKRVFIIHGWEGTPYNHYHKWLKAELEKLGFTVFLPAMPDTDTPAIEGWVNHLREIVGTPDKDTYFVGHSIGCQAILRYLETISTPIGKAVFVAGWFDLKNMETEEEENIAEPWINTPIDTEKVKKVLPSSTIIISDNDPYGALEFNKKKFTELGSKIIVLHNAGHFTKDDGYAKLPEALEEFKNL